MNPPASQQPAWRAFGSIAAVVLVLVVLGHDGRRVAQVMALAAPVLVWLLWPVRHPLLHRARSYAVWLWAMAFALDGVLRAYLLDTYQAAPGSALVQSAAANTNAREAAEYLSMHWRAMLVWSGALAAAGLLVGRYAWQGARHAAPRPRWAVALLAAALLLASVGYLSKPWRRLHPVAFWAGWTESVQVLRAEWTDQQREREAAFARARAADPVVARPGPATVVLVVSDSINRDNMALYGYRRPTTPRLLNHKAQLQDELLVLRNAWSVDASTLPSLRNLFGFGQAQGAQSQHLMALARAAGYKVWWMSNHDDIAVDQEHARFADVVEFINRVPGRAAASLDGELLDCVQEAMEDPAERKLIVVHLMGAHPHYRLRFPADANPFDDHPDEVEQGLARNGRPAWVRRFRQEYDAALLYHDFVVAETLQIARTIGRPDQYRAWMYLSDHGQEVGHGGNHAGHSPSTAAGYRIPTLIWRNDQPPSAPAGTELRPFRLDWAAWSLAHLLQLRWNGSATQRDVLAPDYHWQAPTLPVAVPSFVD